MISRQYGFRYAPHEAFERDGARYECTDILRKVVIGSKTQTITQTESVGSAKKDMEIFLELLPQEKETTTDFHVPTPSSNGENYI